MMPGQMPGPMQGPMNPMMMRAAVLRGQPPGGMQQPSGGLPGVTGMGGAMPMPQQPPGPGPMQAPQMPGTTASPMQNLNFASTPAAPRAPDTLSGSNRGFVTGTGGFGNGLNFARGGY